MLIQENISLATHTYYKIGGPARYFAQPEGVHELKNISSFLKRENLPFFILGAGSNILFDDQGFNGLIIQTSKLDRTLVQNENILEVGAGVRVIEVLRHCMSQGLGGMDFLVGIPGNMGGVFFMNAGTHKGEVKDCAIELRVFNLVTGKERILKKEDLKYSYRHQHFLEPSEIILRGKLKGQVSTSKEVQESVQSLLEKRKSSQPIDKPSCGSVFKNPDPQKGLHAWKLIDEAGLRGFQVGGAQISPMHTNFIVNLGGATAADVKACINEAKHRVQKKFGVLLEEEVQIVPSNF